MRKKDKSDVHKGFGLNFKITDLRHHWVYHNLIISTIC